MKKWKGWRELSASYNRVCWETTLDTLLIVWMRPLRCWAECSTPISDSNVLHLSISIKTYWWHQLSDMLMNKVEFLEKTAFFLIRPETHWVMCYFRVFIINTCIWSAIVFLSGVPEENEKSEFAFVPQRTDQGGK